ncbi:hypothetical protein EI94DRAFT_1737680 [Lactarius quietus]|nr:hypothetical protein EI94DRAFT_1737680 [Lactarius quietus]
MLVNEPRWPQDPRAGRACSRPQEARYGPQRVRSYLLAAACKGGASGRGVSCAQRSDRPAGR